MVSSVPMDNKGEGHGTDGHEGSSRSCESTLVSGTKDSSLVVVWDDTSQWAGDVCPDLPDETTWQNRREAGKRK